jgi:hypothetical protein
MAFSASFVLPTQGPLLPRPLSYRREVASERGSGRYEYDDTQADPAGHSRFEGLMIEQSLLADRFDRSTKADVEMKLRVISLT